MNKQGENGIEWTQWTWNVIGGCEHDCEWQMPDGSIAECYAKTVAERVAQAHYPHGFRHHYWHPNRLDEPLKLKEPARIFLDSMSDLMGAWVPAEQIQQVLDVCRKAEWHTFQLLTKNAPRLRQFRFPPNVWVGASVPPTYYRGNRLSQHQQKAMLSATLTVLGALDVPVRWMSIEPLSWNVVEDFHPSHPLDWVVIGAASNGKTIYQPEPRWLFDLVAWMDATDTPVFYKGNVRSNAAVQFTGLRVAYPQFEARQMTLL